MTSYQNLISEQRAYHALCDEARAMSLPVSLDDPRSPQTVDDLRKMVERRELDCAELGMCPYCSSDNLTESGVCRDCSKEV